MLNKYRNSISATLQSARSHNLRDLVLNIELSISSSSEDLSSVLYCRGTKSSYTSFLKSHHAFPLSEVVSDLSLSPLSPCPDLSVSTQEDKIKQLLWDSPFTCLLIWASKSQSLKKLTNTVSDIDLQGLPITFISVCLDSKDSISSAWTTCFVEGLGGITSQGFEISEVPCFILLKQSEIYAVLDLSHNIVDRLKDMVNGVPAKVQVRLGSVLQELKTEQEIYHLIIFPDLSNDYFSRHLTQILDENPEISEKIKVTVAGEDTFKTILYSSGSFFIVHNSIVVLKSDTSCTDIDHILKNLFIPSSLSSDDFSEKKSRFDYSQSEWQQKYPFCPVPKAVFKFKKTYFAYSETLEEKIVSLQGSYLTVHKEYIQEFFEILTEFFPYAVNSVTYEVPSHTITPGEQCSICDDLLEKVQYLCVYCKPAVYVCQNCTQSHLHPLFRFTSEVSGLDHLTWGAFNLNVGKDEGGESCDIICNGCEEKVVGVRWKCAICSDFDVCAQCVIEAKSHPQSHILIRMGN